METMTEIIQVIIGVIAGGGVTSLFAWRANRRKANGEATQTEADAMKSVQDVYQQTISDLQEYNKQLRSDRDHLRQDRNEIRRENEELRKRQNELDEKVRQLENDVARNGRMLDLLKHLLCGRVNCPNRTTVDLVNGDGNAPMERKPKEKVAKK